MAFSIFIPVSFIKYYRHHKGIEFLYLNNIFSPCIGHLLVLHNIYVTVTRLLKPTLSSLSGSLHISSVYFAGKKHTHRRQLGMRGKSPRAKAKSMAEMWHFWPERFSLFLVKSIPRPIHPIHICRKSNKSFTNWLSCILAIDGDATSLQFKGSRSWKTQWKEKRSRGSCFDFADN